MRASANKLFCAMEKSLDSVIEKLAAKSMHSEKRQVKVVMRNECNGLFMKVVSHSTIITLVATLQVLFMRY